MNPPTGESSSSTGGVLTDCCPNAIPLTLHATGVYQGLNQVCLSYDGAEWDLTYQGIVGGYPTWQGVDTSSCGLTWTVQCKGNGAAALTVTTQCAFSSNTTIEPVCDPFQITVLGGFANLSCCGCNDGLTVIITV
jgi:hypothetical protein